MFCSAVVIYWGTLILPESLETLGAIAFQGCANLTGDLKIPQKVTEIFRATFEGCGFDGSLILHDGITLIESHAFSDTPLKGELVLPKNLTNISMGAFQRCNFSGVLKLPSNLLNIGGAAFAFNKRLTGILEIPDNVLSIGSEAFANCGIQEIIFSGGLESIQCNKSFGSGLGGAFANCFDGK